MRQDARAVSNHRKSRPTAAVERTRTFAPAALTSTSKRLSISPTANLSFLFPFVRAVSATLRENACTAAIVRERSGAKEEVEADEAVERAEEAWSSVRR